MVSGRRRIKRQDAGMCLLVHLTYLKDTALSLSITISMPNITSLRRAPAYLVPVKPPRATTTSFCDSRYGEQCETPLQGQEVSDYCQPLELWKISFVAAQEQIYRNPHWMLLLNVRLPDISMCLDSDGAYLMAFHVLTCRTNGVSNTPELLKPLRSAS